MHPLVADYQSGLEEVLTRLLSAEEYLQSDDGTTGGRNGRHADHKYEEDDEEDMLLQQDVETVKSLFHAHEQLMNELTEYEAKVTEMLNEGKVLLESNYCSNEEKKGIECQRSLLSSRWQRLQQRSHRKQSRLHEALMLLQQKQMDNLKAWLISAEDRISHFTEIGPDLRSVHRQLRDYQTLQQEVAEQQDTVNSLSNVVVIIDGVDCDSENVSNDFEDQLNALSEKWAHACRFIDDRGRTLDIVCRNWQLLEDEEIKFNDWIAELERRLSQMEETTGHLDAGPSVVAQSIQRLQQLEQEVEQQHVHYSTIVEEGQKLLDHLEKPSQAWNDVNGKLERLTDVWDMAVQRMENLGLALTKAASAPKTRKQEIPPPSAKVSENQGATSGSKKIRLDSALVKEWQRELENISTWLGRIEDDLGLDDEENGAVVWEELAVEEQQILLEDTETAVEEKRDIVDHLIEQGKEIITGLKSYGENVKKLEDIVEAVDERWALVKEELDRKKIKIRTTSELARINSEADAMKRVLHSHQKWLQSAEASIENIRDLEKIEEQSRVRSRSMQIQKKKVDKMREEIEDILDDLPQLGDDESMKDIKYFIGFWETINDRNNDLQKKIRTKSREIKRQSMQAAGIQMPLHVAPDSNIDHQDDKKNQDSPDASDAEPTSHSSSGHANDDCVDSSPSEGPLNENSCTTKSHADQDSTSRSSRMDDRRSSSSSGEGVPRTKDRDSKVGSAGSGLDSKYSEKYPLEAVAYDEVSDSVAGGRKAIRPSSLDTRIKPVVPPKAHKSPQQDSPSIQDQVTLSPKATPTSPIYDTVPVSPPSPVYDSVPASPANPPPAHSVSRTASISEDHIHQIILQANERREEIAVVIRQLNSSPELTGKDYESFGKQESGLRNIKESSIDRLKPRVKKLMAERTELEHIDADHQVHRVVEKMWMEWQSLRELFMRRHRRWWRAREVLQQFESALTQVNSWLDSTEKSLSASRLPSGELNMQSAHQLQESLLKQFSQQIPVYGTVCVLSRRVISQCATEYGVLLQEQLETVDQRWNAVVRELAWRSERLQAETRNLDITDRCLQLTAFLEKVMSSLEGCRGGVQSMDSAKRSLIQFKENERELANHWLNMMTIHLASSLLRVDEVHRIDKHFKEVCQKLPEAVFLLERYLATVRIVSEKLEHEINWTKERQQNNELEQQTDENLDVHEITYEQLLVMIQEIGADARTLGHETPVHLTDMMLELKQWIEAAGIVMPILVNGKSSLVPDQDIEWTKDRPTEKPETLDPTTEKKLQSPLTVHRQLLPKQPLHSTPLPQKMGPGMREGSEQTAQQSNPSLAPESEPFAHFYMSEEEHSLIAQYSQLLGGKAGLSLGETSDDMTAQSPARMMAALEQEQQQELEAIIKLLEAENRLLVAEYEKLRTEKLANASLIAMNGSASRPVTHGSSQEVLITESQAISQDKRRWKRGFKSWISSLSGCSRS